MTGSSPKIPDGTEIVVEAESLFHAQTLVAVLADHDIEAMAAPDIQLGAGVHPDATVRAVPVIARTAEAERARQILAENAERAPNIDWQQEVAQESPQPSITTGRMPLIARAGLIAGLLIIALMLIGTLLMLVW